MYYQQKEDKVEILPFFSNRQSPENINIKLINTIENLTLKTI